VAAAGGRLHPAAGLPNPNPYTIVLTDNIKGTDTSTAEVIQFVQNQLISYEELCLVQCVDNVILDPHTPGSNPFQHKFMSLFLS
jgi:hypothetical protein